MIETNRIEFKRELTRDLDIEKEIVCTPVRLMECELVSGCSRPRNREIMRINGSDRTKAAIGR